MIINAEFFVTHFVIFPAQQAASGTGFFGGSNALWETDVLKRQVPEPTLPYPTVPEPT